MNLLIIYFCGIIKVQIIRNEQEDTKMEMNNCKCGHPPSEPCSVKKLRNGYVIRCSNPQCPATVQRIGKIKCAEAWNEMATRINW